jgi:hypothetical protein
MAEPKGGSEASGPVAAPTRAGWRFHPALIVVIGSCAALFREAMHTGLAGDAYYQLATGRWMLAHHAVIRHDVFSYTVYGKPWLVEEWGYALLLAWLVAHVGAVSYWLISAGACCIALLLSVARWRKVGAGWLWTACLSIVAAAGMYLLVTPRPQDLSYLFFAGLLLLLTLARQRTLWLVAVPPLLLIWANIHGSFLLGLGMIALEVIWSVFPRLNGRLRVSQRLPVKAVGLTLVGSLGATLVNPHGPFLWTYAFKVSSSPVLTSLIAEWQSPDFHSLFLLAIVIGPLLLLVGLLAFTETVFALEDVVLACLMLLATLHAARFMPYLVLAMCAVLSRWAPIRTETIRPTLLTVPVAVLACAALLAGPHTPAGAPQRGGSMGNPVAATSFLKHTTGRVFTTYWWGDYMIYERIPVFVDGRTDLYFGTDILETYTNVANAVVNPDPVFKQWHIRWVMWNTGSALDVYLSADPRWKVAFRSGGDVVFEHIGPW